MWTTAAIRFVLGVSNGARTRDLLDHNQALYQLSYTHHVASGAWNAAHRL